MFCAMLMCSFFLNVQSLAWGSAISKERADCRSKRLVLWHHRIKALMSY